VSRDLSHRLCVPRLQLQEDRRQAISRACIETLESRELFSFAAATNYPVGTNPQEIVTADFNGDGKLDLATVNTGSNNVSVLLGTGAGGFAGAQHFAAASHAAASDPSWLAVADFDGDANPDLAVLFDMYGVYILKGNGNGTFRAPVRHGPGAMIATGIAAGDFNADHKMDLVYTDSDPFSGVGGYVTLMLGNSQGGFTDAMSAAQPSYGLSVGDPNGDGKLDVVTAWWTMLGNGDGTLRMATENGGFSGNPDYYPRAIAIGEMTRDGAADLVLAAANVQVLPGLGNGQFSGSVLAGNETTYYTAVATADFNGDGELDAVATGSAADVWLGNGDGTLRDPVAVTTGTSPSGVASGDLNGDGRPDIAVTNGGSNNVSVILNDGNWASKTYVGPTGGNWSTASNWSPSGAPTAADSVVITGTSVNLSASATVARLTIDGGATLTVAQNGARVLRTGPITIGGTSKLNLNDNDLIVDYTGASALGSWNGSAYTGVTGLIARGYNFSAWDGSGLVTTMTDAHSGLTTLAPAEAADVLGITGNQTSVWHGQVLDATTVIVKYTYAGDVNLDGLVDASDYGTIDNYYQFPGTTGYTNGDFNFDGVIDAGDYGLIDNSFQLQGPAL